MTSLRLPHTALFLLGTLPFASAAPTLTKLHDFNNTGVLLGVQGSYDTPILIGSDLWFTTDKGGDNGFGTLSSFKLTNNTVTKRVSLDNETGNTPQSAPTVSDGFLYYTTTRGGTGDRGTLNGYDLTGSTNTVLWNSLSNSPTTNPNTLPGNVAVIDRGALGKDVYILTQGGGLGAAIGTIQRYNTLTGIVTQVHAFGNTPDSRQPFKGFTVVGNKLYFTTFTGGNVSPSGHATGSATNGCGTLNEFDVTVRDGEVYTQLALMPNEDASFRFLAHNPYYRAADHSLYFGSVGTNSSPGALMKFDLTLRKLSVLHEIMDDQTTAAPVRYPEGKAIYGSVIEWNRALYYCTFQGGANAPTGSTAGGGTINRYNLDSATHEVLFNLDISTGNNNGGEVRGGFLHNGSATFPAFYLITHQGGANDHGTILRMNLDLPLPASAYENWLAANPGISGANTAPAADADEDGIPNSSEFAYGTDPASGANPALSVAVPSETGLEIRWTARTDNSVTYTVTGSPSLGVDSPWTPVALPVEVIAEPDVVVPSGYERRRVTIPVTEVSGFFRVEANIPKTSLP
ncbi:MAG: hypothetical protein EOP87_06165 [Verrucomicrobiaceae bacterium]|nr:MAG: hypothetical protein EOP87_06165 [Verrucomicrobiaceae bacterium]